MCVQNYKKMNYFMQNRPIPGFIGIFTAASWNNATGKSGLGFLFVDSNANICCVGSCPSHLEGKLQMELRAIIMVLLTIK